MDAVVFFVIAITISSILFFYVDDEVLRSAEQSDDDQSNPGAILKVFLHSSLGADIVLQLNGEVRIPGSSEIVECISTELEALALGQNLTDFSPLNDRLIIVLRSICSPVMEPFLMAINARGQKSDEMFSIPRAITESGTQLASSTRLPSSHSSYLLILVLVPSSNANPAS